MLETASLERFEDMLEDNQDASEHPEEEPGTHPAPPDTHKGYPYISGQPKAEEQLLSSSPASFLPPEARGETNGGPLGCCLGVTIGLTLSLIVAVVGRIYANPLVPVFHSSLLVLILLRIAMAIAAIAGAVLCGYFGWKVGKKLYREYDPPVIKDRRRKPKEA